MKNMIFVTLLLLANLTLASPFVKPSEPNGMLNFSVLHTSKEIFPVSLFEIDGKQVIKRDNAVWLKPGTHTIRLNAKIDLKQRNSTITRRQKSNNPGTNNTLEINVEEGKTYYVGYDTSDRDPNQWRPVVWKTK